MTGCPRILVGTDFSDHADFALERALDLASRHESTLRIVHVLRSRTSEWTTFELTPQDQERLKSQVQRDLEERADRAAARKLAVESAVLVGQGDPHEAISREAERIGAELVVVGARGDRSFLEDILGTTPEGLLADGACDLLIVKNGPTSGYARVLVCLDLQEGSAAAVTSARAVCPDAELFLLHAYDVPFETALIRAGVEDQNLARYHQSARASLDLELERLSILGGAPTATRMLERGPARRVIPNAAARLGCDLVVMAPHRSLLSRVPLLSVSAQLVSRLPCDTLFTGGRTRSDEPGHSPV